MISFSKTAGMALLILAFASPVVAQVCKEPGASTSGKANMDCDMTYRDTLVTCDAQLDPSDPKCNVSGGKKPDQRCLRGTRPSCPKKPMPMIDTPNKSFIQDYTPYLWNYPRDADDASRPYTGAYALGTPGDTSRVFQIFGNTAPGTKRLASCTTQIRVPSDPTTNGEWAKLTRLQVDNCTNQYLLRASVYPVQKDSSKLLSMDNPAKPGVTINTDTECQPLKTFTESENEYAADYYLKAAWNKLMNDASARVSTPSAAKCIPRIVKIADCDKDHLPGCRVNDHEPHLPCAGPGDQGLTLENPMAPPSDFREVRLSNISTFQYENINDPSHPFSPRWDYVLSDRDYANASEADLGILSTNGLLVNQAMGLYMTDKKNDLFCAGVKKSTQTDAKKKNDDEVNVDVLSFRKKAFEGKVFIPMGQGSGVLGRSSYNAVCYKNVPPPTYPVPTPFILPPQLPQLLLMMATSWCYQIDSVTVVSILPPLVQVIAHNNPCWKCYGLSGKVDDETQHPPCTTHYLGTDLTMKGPVFGGGLNNWSRNAQCGTNMPKLCSDLRRPYTNLNVLKMRYHRTDDDDDKDGDNNVLKNGAGEGMTFKEYFGNHMPYPRMWDMNGVSLQASPATDRKYQPPTDTTGQYTAIVGIGREAASKVASDAAGADADGKKPIDKHKDERCLAGGWGTTLPIVTFGGVTLTVPDPLTSWTEMKLYEARTLRNIGTGCIARYEKVFKPGGAENMMLLRAGGMWQQLLINKCDVDKSGLTKNCKTMTYKEYKDAGFPANSSTVIYLKSLEPQNIPQPWRGYLVAAEADNQFPKWPEASPSIGSGLGSATPGDIILLPKGPTSSGGTGLAKLAFVIEAKKDEYVRVLEPDDGKWPDSCGSTDTWGEMKTRYYYKPGKLPYDAGKEYSRIGTISDCIETKLSVCEQSGWGSLQVYHIRDDKRTGCQNKSKAVDCEKDE